MSTTSISDDPYVDATSSSSSDPPTSTPFNYVVTHVFLPVQPPYKDDYTLENEHSLARTVCAAAHAYGSHLYETSEKDQWNRIRSMLDNLQASVQLEHMDNVHVISRLREMQTGGAFAGFPRIPGRADNF
jgi:hypothetical protein